MKSECLSIGQDEEALAFRELYFANDDNVSVRHWPLAKIECLSWQVGVIEGDEVQCCDGKTRVVERFHLMAFASTKAQLIELLGRASLPSC